MIQNNHPNPDAKRRSDKAAEEFHATQKKVNLLLQQREQSLNGERKKSLILYMDDVDTQSILKAFFEDAGFQVDIASDPRSVEDALETLGHSSPLILDEGSLKIMETRLNGKVCACIILSRKDVEFKKRLNLNKRSTFWVVSPIDPRAIVALVKNSL